MDLVTGPIQEFKKYSQFESLTEFNEFMDVWVAENKMTFTNAELTGLWQLVRLSSLIPGICKEEIRIILKFIQEHNKDHGISESTFRRMTSKAVDLGILTIYKTSEPNGAQSSNLYVFNRNPNLFYI